MVIVYLYMCFDYIVLAKDDRYKVAQTAARIV